VEELLTRNHSGGRCLHLLRYQPASLLPAGNPDGNVNIMYHLVIRSARWKRKWALLAPRVRHRQLEGGRTTISCWSRSVCSVRVAWDNYATCSYDRQKPHDDLLADNNQTTARPVNENWVASFLELFSMGVGATRKRMS